MRPLRLYERWETTTALMLATLPRPEAPHRLGRAMPALWQWRATPAGIVVGGARRHPERLALADPDEALTYGELDARTSALAHALGEAGVGPDSTVGLLCHNRVAFLVATMAVHKLGAALVLLNTGFAAPQVADVVTREGVDVLLHDDALAPATAEVTGAVLRLSTTDLATMTAASAGERVPPPRAAGRVVVLTSGTTGRPKGAVRSAGGNPLDAAAILTTVPIVGTDTTLVAAPLFHGLGHFFANLGLALGGRVVVRPTFDAATALADVAAHRATVFVAVPAMLQRLLALPDRAVEQHDLSSLRMVICG